MHFNIVIFRRRVTNSTTVQYCTFPKYCTITNIIRPKYASVVQYSTILFRTVLYFKSFLPLYNITVQYSHQFTLLYSTVQYSHREVIETGVDLRRYLFEMEYFVFARSCPVGWVHKYRDSFLPNLRPVNFAPPASRRRKARTRLLWEVLARL